MMTSLPNAKATTRHKAGAKEVPSTIFQDNATNKSETTREERKNSEHLKRKLLPPSMKECNYGICAGQTCSSLTKSKGNSIYTYNFK
jgi:hypothetical protein